MWNLSHTFPLNYSNEIEQLSVTTLMKTYIKLIQYDFTGPETATLRLPLGFIIYVVNLS